MLETWLWSLGQNDPLEKGMVIHFSILPGEFHGQRSLAGSRLLGCKKPDTTEQLTLPCVWPRRDEVWLTSLTRACACLVAQSCPTLWDPLDSSPPGSSVHGIFQARILEWVAILPIHRSNPSLLCLLPCRWILYPLSHQGSPDLTHITCLLTWKVLLKIIQVAMSSSFEKALICTYLHYVVKKFICCKFNGFENLLPFYNTSGWDGWGTLPLWLLVGKALKIKSLFVLLSKLPFNQFSLPDNTEIG